MATVNMAQLRIKLAQDSRGKLKAAATSRAEQVFKDSVDGLREGFENLSVTQEIAAGIDAPNLSETLGGGDAPKSLYAFIGFAKGDDPLQPIRKRLDPVDSDGPKLRYVGKDAQNPRFTFSVSTPKLDKIYTATPMPWASGLSWAEKIETTIPGFARFLDRFMPNATDAVSRSKGGTQVKRDLRPDRYTKPRDGFLKKLFADFLATIKDASRTGRVRGEGGRFQSFE